jgi:pimeloyl-ACP methyl ester carboxylesterase
MFRRMGIPGKPPRGLRRRRRGASRWIPEPPVELPPSRTVEVPGRGELFVRDSGGDGPVVLLLHGWVVSADLNWFTTYSALGDAGYRVLAIDHRGHGRGLRTLDDFRLVDCAADAAGLLGALGIERASAVGYSMGGPIACLLARDRPERLSGLVLCATSTDWKAPNMRAIWASMGVFRIVLGLFPRGFWRRALRAAGFPDSQVTTWFTAELTRGSAVHIAEAGRELGRYDARPWIANLTLPAAVIVTTRDTAVPPAKQRELADRLGAPQLEVAGDHAAVTVKAAEFNAALLRALELVGAPRSGSVSAAA